MSNILYVTLIENPINNGIINSQVIGVLEQLAEAGHKVTLFSAPSNRLFARHTEQEIMQFQAKLARNSIKLCCFPIPVLTNASVRFFLIPWLLLFSLPAVLFVALKENVDVIHCRSYPAGLVGMLVKILTRKKYVFDMRGIYPEEGSFLFPSWHKGSLNFKAWKWIEGYMLRSADHIVVVSERFRQHVLSEYPAYADDLEKKISTIVCGIATGTMLDRLPSRMSPHNPIRLVYSGTLDGWTSPQLLAETYRKIVVGNPQQVFWLNIYTTSNQDAIRDALKAVEIGDDKYAIQRLRSDEVQSKLRENDIGILVRESSVVNMVSFPVKLGEYLAAGLPVVINDALIGAGEFVLRHNVGVVLDEGHSIQTLTTSSVCLNGIAGALAELANTAQSYVTMYASQLSSERAVN